MTQESLLTHANTYHESNTVLSMHEDIAYFLVIAMVAALLLMPPNNNTHA